MEQTISLCASKEDDLTDLRFYQDHAVCALSWLAVTLWPLGYPAQSEAAITAAVERAQEIGHVMTTALALFNKLFLMGYFGTDPQRVLAHANDAIEYYAEHGVTAYTQWAVFCQGLSLARSDDALNGIERMRIGVAAAEKISANLFRSMDLGHLGVAHASLGEMEVGLGLLDKALLTAEETQERVFEAELHRLRGEVLVSLGNSSEAEATLETALMVARSQKARMWELRAAVSLARLRRTQGRSAEACKLLAPVYCWFTEGFDTPDLKEAKALLDELDGL